MGNGIMFVFLSYYIFFYFFINIFISVIIPYLAFMANNSVRKHLKNTFSTSITAIYYYDKNLRAVTGLNRPKMQTVKILVYVSH